MLRTLTFMVFGLLCLCVSACGTDSTSVEGPAAATSEAATTEGAQAPLPPVAESGAVATVEEPATEQPTVEPEPEWKAEDEPLRTPATIKQAADLLDLRTFPVMENSELPGGRNLANLNAKVAASAKEVMEFYRDELLARGFRTVGERGPDDFSGGLFFKDGFLISLTVSPAYGDDSAGKHSVYIHNHGNVNTYKLPVPEDVQAFYGTPIGASYTTEASVAETSAAMAKLLLADGWKPYGAPQGSLFFKQHAVRLMVSIQSAPAQGGKTIMTFSTEQLSADLPAPSEAENVQYSDSTKDLRFDYPGSETELATYYQTELQPAGWESTTENPVQIDFTKFMIFRNEAKDMLELQMREYEGKQRASVTFHTAEEVAEIERLEKAKIAELNSKTPPATPKLALALPVDLTNFSQTASSMEFSVPAGQAKPVVEGLVAKLKEEGWKDMDSNLQDMFGSVTLIKDSQTLSLTYVETGVVPPQVIIMAFGVEIERAKE